MDTNSFADIFAKAQNNPRFWEEMSILEFTESVAKRLESLSLTRTDLASKLGVSPAFITKLMCGKNNFTLRTMVRVARSLGCELTVGLTPAALPTASPVQVLPTENNSVLRLATPHELHLQDVWNQFTSVRSVGASRLVVSEEMDHPPQNADLALTA